MATRRAATNNAVQTLGDMNDNTVAALIPVNSKGETVNVEGQDWRMPTGGGHSPHPDEEFDPEDLPEDQSPVDRIVAMLRGANDGDRSYLKVSRVAGAGQIEFCAQYSAADFESGGLQMIQEQWGPGEYQLILYGLRTLPSGKDHFGIRDRTNVKIAAPLKPLKGAAEHAQPSELQSFMERQSQTMERMLQALTERPAAPDPMTQMTGMLGMMKLMREAMGLDVAPKPAGGLKDIVDAIKQLREVNEEINPGATPETPMSMVSKMLPLIQQGLAARQVQPQAQPAPVMQQPMPPVAIPAPLPVSLPQPQPTPPQTDMNIIEQKGYLSTLVSMAKARMPITEGAQFVYDKLHDNLIDALARDDWFDLLSQITGDISAEKEWFTEVRSAALALFEAPEGEDTSETATPD